jgi:hypothetical protein
MLVKGSASGAALTGDDKAVLPAMAPATATIGANLPNSFRSGYAKRVFMIVTACVVKQVEEVMPASCYAEATSADHGKPKVMIIAGPDVIG